MTNEKIATDYSCSAHSLACYGAEECFEEHIFDEKERIEHLRYANEYEQVAEWLEELKSYRALVFSGDMTQKMLKEEYNKAIDDFVEELKRKTPMENILIDELAEQLKVGEQNE